MQVVLGQLAWAYDFKDCHVFIGLYNCQYVRPHLEFLVRTVTLGRRYGKDQGVPGEDPAACGGNGNRTQGQNL